jgi:transposase InsO family protein
LQARRRRGRLPAERGAHSVIAANVLDRQFQADMPNCIWVPLLPTSDRPIGAYMCPMSGVRCPVYVVLTLHSRRAVGWSMQVSMTSQLGADALMMAVLRRGRPVAPLHRSDQRSQYASEHFHELLKEQGIHLQHEQSWRGVEQLGEGKPLQFIEDGPKPAQGLQRGPRYAPTCLTISSTNTTQPVVARRSVLSVR